MTFSALGLGWHFLSSSRVVVRRIISSPYLIQSGKKRSASPARSAPGCRNYNFYFWLSSVADYISLYNPDWFTPISTLQDYTAGFHYRITLQDFTTGLHQGRLYTTVQDYIRISLQDYTRIAGADQLFTTGLHQDCWCMSTFHYRFKQGQK